MEIEKIIPGGQTLATHPDGRKVFFWNALPGEKVVEYEVTREKSHFLEAIATKIENPSKYRVEPKDACYLSTSPWQIFGFKYELEQKRELVQESFREHKIEIELPEIMTDNKQFFYRNKMEYALYWDNELEKIELGFHTRGAHQKFPIKQSSLEMPAIFQAAEKLVKRLNSHHAAARRFQSLLLRANQHGEVSGGLFEKHQPHPHFEPLADEILGRKFRYSPNGFFQVNLPVYELALLEIQKYIKTERVLDLYAGVGTIGLSVASDRELTLVESDRFAYRELLENLPEDPKNPHPDYLADPKTLPEQNPIIPLEVKVKTGSGLVQANLAKSEEVLDFITSDTTVILDPPRAGCHAELVEKIVAEKPKAVIYLSCNPATQARDLEKLLTVYKLEKDIVFNFFPKTPHIENLVVLSR